MAFVAAPSLPSTSSANDELASRPMIPRSPTLLEPPSRRHRRPHNPRILRLFRSLCRTFPVFSPRCTSKLPQPCRLPTISGSGGLGPTSLLYDVAGSARSRVTGTLYGHRRGRVSLCVQESPRCLPSVIVELALNTQVVMKDMGAGMVRIALECEKRAENGRRLMEEPLWTVFYNGKKSGYGVRREPAAEDLAVMELLRSVSMGAGVLPDGAVDAREGEMAYVRAFFEHVAASRDSETLYILSPSDSNGPELTIFFVRL
ncbi:hypothetical protein AXF42_Ash003258 [Apostasia shenzhenica]|uniref:Protein MIZU-KUSSEI 1 n=1 Tax=Apostasia shenzhenica TaxID=1088818 RepID=A0A2I0BFL8_9ASPA|nr:hypothetical protein AXF42_Ash003258 [Apostasia shenzhenica]